MTTRAALILALAGLCLPQAYAQPMAAAPSGSSAIEGPNRSIGRDFFGLHIHRFADGVPWPDPAISAYRTWDAKVRWADLQPARDKWDFSRLDRIVDRAGKANVDVLMPLGMPPAWASSRPTESSAYRPGEAASPRDMADWTNYVKAVAERYRGKILLYEIWNEPNLPKFFSGSIQEAVQLTCAARTVLRAADPRNRVVSPAPLGDYGVIWLKRFLAAGGGACADIIGYHFYNKHQDPETHVAIAASIREALTAAKLGSLPVWNTEAGWLITAQQRKIDTTVAGFAAGSRTLDAAQGAAIVARTLVLHAAVGLGRSYWYALDNEAMGLQEADGSPKPALTSLIQTARLLTGKSISGCARGGALWTCTLTAQGRAVSRLVWTTGNGAVTVPELQRYVRAEIMGQSAEVDVQRGAAAVAEGAVVAFQLSP